MNYTYKIGWSKYNIFYYGVRTANKNSPEKDLWIKYFTSSKIVKEFREKNGEPDIIQIDKTFDNITEAIDYESKYIKENQIHMNESWLNKACWPVVNSKGIKRSPLSKEHRKKIAKALKGIKRSPRTKEHNENFSNAVKGKTPWNKGLDKSDPRVAKNAKGVSKALTGKPSLNKGKKFPKTQEQITKWKETRRKNKLIDPDKYKMTKEQIEKRQKSRKKNALIQGRKY